MGLTLTCKFYNSFYHGLCAVTSLSLIGNQNEEQAILYPLEYNGLNEMLTAEQERRYSVWMQQVNDCFIDNLKAQICISDKIAQLKSPWWSR
jgi:hypothetical protein